MKQKCKKMKEIKLKFDWKKSFTWKIDFLQDCIITSLIDDRFINQ